MFVHFKYFGAWSCYFVPIIFSKIVFNKGAMKDNTLITAVLLFLLLSLCNVCIVY